MELKSTNIVYKLIISEIKAYSQALLLKQNGSL